MPGLIPNHPNTLLESIVNFAIDNNTEGLNKIVKMDTPVNIRQFGYDAVYFLAKKDEQEATFLLLDKYNTSLKQALLGAAEANNEKLVCILQERYLVENQSNEELLQGFAFANNRNQVKALLEQGTPLEQAVIGFAKASNDKEINSIISKFHKTMHHVIFLGAIKGYAMAGNEKGIRDYFYRAQQAGHSLEIIYFHILTNCWNYGHAALVTVFISEIDKKSKNQKKIQENIAFEIAVAGHFDLVNRLIVHWGSVHFATLAYNQQNNIDQSNNLIALRLITQPNLMLTPFDLDTHCPAVNSNLKLSEQFSIKDLLYVLNKVSSSKKNNRILALVLRVCADGEKNGVSLQSLMENTVVEAENGKLTLLDLLLTSECINIFKYLIKNHPKFTHVITKRALNSFTLFEMPRSSAYVNSRILSPLYTICLDEDWKMISDAINLPHKVIEEVFFSPFEYLETTYATFRSPAFEVLRRPEGLTYLLENPALKQMLANNLSNPVLLYWILSRQAGRDWLSANPDYLNTLHVLSLDFSCIADLMMSCEKLHQAILSRPRLMNVFSGLHRAQLRLELERHYRDSFKARITPAPSQLEPTPQLVSNPVIALDPVENELPPLVIEEKPLIIDSKAWLAGLAAIFCEADKISVLQWSDGEKTWFSMSLPASDITCQVRDGKDETIEAELTITPHFIRTQILERFKEYAEFNKIATIEINEHEVLVFPQVSALNRLKSRQNRTFEQLIVLNRPDPVIEVEEVVEEIVVPGKKPKIIEKIIPEESNFLPITGDSLKPVKKMVFSFQMQQVVTIIHQALKRYNLKVKMAATGSYASDLVESVVDEAADLDLTSTFIPEWVLNKLGLYKNNKVNFAGVAVLFTGKILDIPVDLFMVEDSDIWLQDNVQYRDFNRSCLFIDLSNNYYYDPTGKGNQDIFLNHLRSILQPADCFKRDASRVLRAIKFYMTGTPFSLRLEQAILQWTESEINSPVHNAFIVFKHLKRFKPLCYIKTLKKFKLLEKLFDIDNELSDEEALKQLSEKVERIVIIYAIEMWSNNEKIKPGRYPEHIYRDLQHFNHDRYTEELEKKGLLKKVFKINYKKCQLSQISKKVCSLAEKLMLDRLLTRWFNKEDLDPREFATAIQKTLRRFNPSAYLLALAAHGFLKEVFNMDYYPRHAKKIADQFLNNIEDVIAAANKKPLPISPVNQQFMFFYNAPLQISYRDALMHTQPALTATVHI